MALADLLLKSKTSAADSAQASVDRLTAELREAHEHAETVNTEWAEALLQEDVAASDRLEKAWQTAQRDLQRKANALKAAKIHLSNAQAEAQVKAITDTWGSVEAASAARAKAVNNLARSAEVFAADWAALVAATAGLSDALPASAKNDPDATLLWPVHIETAVRRELLRLGVDWAFNTPWGKVSIPEFLPQFQGAAEVVDRLKSQALAGKK